MKKYKEYKDSGVKWIGIIPSHWKTPKLNRLVSKIGSGSTPRGGAEVYVSEGVKFIRSQNVYFEGLIMDGIVHITPTINEKMKNTQVFPCDVLLNITGGSIGRCFYVENSIGKANVNQHVCIIRPTLIDYRFTKYFLQSYSGQSQVWFYQKGDREGLSAESIKRFRTPYPTSLEQKAIVSYLDEKINKIDKYIATAEKKIAALDELKQVTIADAVTHGTNPNAPMKDSDIPWIGMVPEHWKVKRAAIMFSENKNKNSKYEFSHAFKFNYGTLVPKDETGDVSEYRDTYEAYTIIKKNDIAINCLNLNYDFVSQRVAISPNKGILTSAYLIITPRNGVNPYYYNYLFKAMDSKKLFHGMGTGIRLTLSYTELKKQFLPNPSFTEQNEIVAYIDRKVAQIDRMKTAELAQIEKLKEYKQSLISDVVTGKVKVTND